MAQHARRRSSPPAWGPTVVVIVLLLVGTLCLWAQEDDQVFAPFVSRVRISMNDPQVRISWQDAEDIEATYQVVRHTEPVTAETIGAATLVGTVKTGVESYIDSPAEPGQYYYAVLAIASDGGPYKIFIPGRNTTYRAADVTNLETVADRVALVRSIEASVTTSASQSGISIAYSADREGRTLMVYRSTQPFTDPSDVQRGSVVTQATSASGQVTDFPVPGVGYYYAIADAESILEGTVTFVARRNTTGTPVEIPIPEQASRDHGTAEPSTETPRTHSALASTEPAPTAVASGAVTSEPGTAPAPGPRTESGLVPLASITVHTVAASVPRPVPLPFLQLQSEISTGVELTGDSLQVPRRQPVSDVTQASVTRLIDSLEPIPARTLTPQLLRDDTLVDPKGAEYTRRTVLTGPFAQMAWEEVVAHLDYFFMLPLTAELRARAHSTGLRHTIASIAHNWPSWSFSRPGTGTTPKCRPG
ncbi:MAG: hypothetical protein E4H09_00800 [Spirochaetales bacterium]|nr:MAG: hypothetical protein E4H09_00800 [Spirochaetales bacterium]